jgi:transposase
VPRISAIVLQCCMAAASDLLPDDKDALKAALIETRAKLSGAEAMIEHLQLVIAKMKRELFGPRSERSQRLIDQLELQLEELAAAAGEDEAEAAAARVQVQGFTRRNATRRNFPADLPRRRSPLLGSSWLVRKLDPSPFE